MALIDEAVERIRRITDSDTRDKATRALRASVIWDGVEDGRKPTSAETVVSSSGLGPDVLEANFILLSKRTISIYASELGATRTLHSIRKSLTASTYRSLFGDGRAEVRSGKMLLVTYAEARSFLHVENKGSLPTI